MRCSSCASRPARRACPALGAEICPVCCGTKRQVEINCPESCPYLASARLHPPVTIRKQQEQDMAIVGPGLHGLSDPQQRLFLFVLTIFPRVRGTGFDAARDADVADAANALASTYETESKGVIYEHRAGSVPARRMAAEIKTALDALGRDRPSSFGRDAALVLRRFERLVRDAAGSSPQESTVLLDAIGRVAERVTAAGFGSEDDEHPQTGSEGTDPPAIVL